MGMALQYSTVQHSTVQHSTLQYTSHLDGDGVADEAPHQQLGLLVGPHELVQLHQVDVHVVVRLHDVLGAITVLSEPLQQHQGLDGEVGVGVYEGLLHDVPVLVRLALQLLLVSAVHLLAHQEHHLQQHIV